MRRYILLALVLIIIIIGGVYFWLHRITSKIFIPQTKVASADITTIKGRLENKSPFNILLLGYGGGNHEGPYLTDSIIVAHIDPKQQKTFLLSLPRDIWVKIPTNGKDGSYSKINAAYSDGLDDNTYPNKEDQFKGPDGGNKLAGYVVSQVTGVPIDYVVGLDFSGFTNTINTLNGVDINVQTAFDDYQYPIEGKENDQCGVPDEAMASISAQIATASAQEADFFQCRFEHLHFDKGEQHMDGTTALKYVRSRHSLQDGTDFGRAERQRNLIVAVKNEVFSLGFIPKIIPFMTSLGDDLRTDLAPDDVKTLIQNASVLNKYQIVSLALTDQNYLVNTVTDDKQDVLESKDGIDNWTSVHNWLKDEFSGKAQPVPAVVQVQNGTQTAGLAQKATNTLNNLNIQVVDPASAKEQNVKKTKITVYDKNIKPADLAAIKKTLGVNTVTYGTTNQTDYNVLVTVGEDYAVK